MLFPKDWDADRQRWKPADPDEVPSLADGVREFDRRVRAVDEDRRTGLVTLSIEWRDRKVAADWANDMVRRANARMQARSIDEARRTIEYLTREASSEDSVAVREGLYKIVESQYKSMALASVRQDFAFRVIDAAVPPDADDIAFPRRAVFAAVGGFVGLLIGGVLLLFEVRRRPNNRLLSLAGDTRSARRGSNVFPRSADQGPEGQFRPSHAGAAGFLCVSHCRPPVEG